MADSEIRIVDEGTDDSLWESSVVCLCRVDGKGGIVRHSPGFRNLMSNGEGPMPAELSTLIHPEDRDFFMERLQRACQRGTVLERETVRMHAAGGRIIAMEVSVQPVKNGNEGDAILAWWEKPSPEDQGEGLAEETPGWFQEVARIFMSSLSDPVLLLNTEGRIVTVNQPFQELLGYKTWEVSGNPVAVLFEKEKDRIPEAMLGFARRMQKGKMKDVAAQWLKQDGTPVPVTMSGALVRSGSGELLGMLVVGRDQRQNVLMQDLEKKNVELEKAYQDLKRLDMMKDDILSLVGHELRAPLANILGYSEFILDWNLSEKEKREYVRVIYQESQHLKRLVNDILELSRMEAGRMVYNHIRGSINRVVRDAADSLRADARAKNIEIDLELNEHIDPVEFDPDRIQQVVTNIIHNAIKFTPRGGVIRVRTAPTEDGVKVSIADQGIGIARQDAHKVFEKFGQIADVRHHHEGAGLGMPIAKTIVEEGHNGAMWFESGGKDKGTTFIFTLPERRSEP